MPDIVCVSIKKSGLDIKRILASDTSRIRQMRRMLILRRADNVPAEPATSMAIMRKTGSFPLKTNSPRNSQERKSAKKSGGGYYGTNRKSLKRV